MWNGVYQRVSAITPEPQKALACLRLVTTEGYVSRAIIGGGELDKLARWTAVTIYYHIDRDGRSYPGSRVDEFRSYVPHKAAERNDKR